MKKKAISHLSTDKKLRPIIEQFQIPEVKAHGDVYETLIRAIVYQQLSGKAAGTIHGRFLNLFRDKYPHPHLLKKKSVEKLRSVGLSRQKSSYILNVADYFQQEKLNEVNWSKHSDEEIIEKLTTIKGVGTWTVQMLLISTLGRKDVFPLDDLGIQNAVKKLYRIKEEKRALKEKMLARAEKWRPYRTYACLYLWRWIDS